MQRQRIASFICVSLALAACHKQAPDPQAAPAKPAETAAPSSTSELPGGVTLIPNAPASEASVETAAAPPAEASKTAAGEGANEPEAQGGASAAKEETKSESAPAKEEAKTDEKPAAGEEHAADAKKSAKKKGDKGEKAETAVKEEKPKFTELGVQVTKAGSGVAATTGKRVTLHYKASLADAEKPFDSTFASNRPLEIDLGTGARLPVIEGLRRGLEGLSAGSEARLQIPANLAWGEKGNPAVGVPANADVVFEVQVLDVQ